MDLALDPAAVLPLVAGPFERWAGFAPSSCRAQVLKRIERRLVVRYDLAGSSGSASIVGKWYSTDRGAGVADALSHLQGGSSGGDHPVPALVAYVPVARALFVEAVDGTLLREALRTDQAAAGRAGAWLAAFHRSGLSSSRGCGPQKQRRAVSRWSEEQPQLREVAPELVDALGSLPDPRGPVHYDYYHSQILLARDRTVTFDLDEAGMGDPAFDLVHFEAHLELLALQWFSDADALREAARAFREAYRRQGGPASDRSSIEGPLRAFSWLKLAWQALRRNAPRAEVDHAMEAVRGSLSTA